LVTKMCHISAVPRPSRISTPKRSFQAWYRLSGRASPADVTNRRLDRSAVSAFGWPSIWLMADGTWTRIVGRWRSILS